MGEKIKELNPLGYKPVGKLLKSLAIPAIIANLVNALYNVVDQIFYRTRNRIFRKCCNKYCLSNYNYVSSNRSYFGNWRGFKL